MIERIKKGYTVQTLSNSHVKSFSGSSTFSRGTAVTLSMKDFIFGGCK